MDADGRPLTLNEPEIEEVHRNEVGFFILVLRRQINLIANKLIKYANYI